MTRAEWKAHMASEGSETAPTPGGGRRNHLQDARHGQGVLEALFLAGDGEGRGEAGVDLGDGQGLTEVPDGETERPQWAWCHQACSMTNALREGA